MFKTKLTLDIEIETQFGPEDAVNMIRYMTNNVNVPAIRSVTLHNLQTDYSPLTEQDANRKVMSGYPITLK